MNQTVIDYWIKKPRTWIDSYMAYTYECSECEQEWEDDEESTCRCLTDQSTDESTDESTDQSTDQSTDECL